MNLNFLSRRSCGSAGGALAASSALAAGSTLALDGRRGRRQRTLHRVLDLHLVLAGAAHVAHLTQNRRLLLAEDENLCVQLHQQAR